MRLFPIIFLIVYSFMHLFIVLKARATFKLKSRVTLMLLTISIVMVSMPVILRLYRLYDYYLFADRFYFGSFLWMGFIVLFFSLLLFIELYKVILRVFNYCLKLDLSRFIFPPKFQFILTLFLAIILLFYGLLEANSIRIERVTINTHKLPASINSLRIVQISDVHLGPVIKEQKLKKIAALVASANPDIIVSTGDVVDGQINNHPDFIEPFAKLKPKYGKYGVLGNHEFYIGVEQSLDYMQKAGFIVLRNEGISIEGIINIVGVDDPAIKYYTKSYNISEKEILSKFSLKNFTLLLKHRPVVNSEYIGLFDLQLSGHSHKGQFFPVNLITKFYYDVHAGLAKVSEESYLYVSRGVGTSGPPIRILSPPEITIIDIFRNG